MCRYLAGGVGMGGNSGQLGWFSRDLQVFTWLIAHPAVTELLMRAREQLYEQRPTWLLDASDLRMLDVVLWMQGRA